ncbi:helix-turn-helix domain-containing protein [Rhodococcus sp. HM1]|uniref:ATP-binding protein n=1 Tax=unclassified Rhodococcus (in: high G+C Gram-positive bacteria) TaxID=192944 RepID=UPI0018CF702E|nr:MULTISPECIES: helix-turn-helix domain-containing protein [unclassified Rhodococcus (in: high G+C Gram-positive bacteria)]MBH0122965.1 helix-turn-helix domain-containing protein [Rhodococcus sp. CX]MCK8670953.1 helix-turn-helix domain-containing protein [Rhodococcus sp. HM1]
MTQANDNSFGAVLRRLRKSRSLTQEELAERAGLSVKAVSALERGERQRPYPHTVRALAAALDLDDADRDRLSAAIPASARPAPRRTGTWSVAAPATDLIGRDGDIERIAALVSSGRRLVTVTGPGGVGKTRVAFAVLEQLAPSYDVTVAVDLAPVRDPAQVLPQLAAAVDLPERGAGGVTERLVAAFAGRRALVFLDNFEHLLDAGPDVADLLTRCPGLMLLVTSRAALRVRAEYEVGLGPLHLPRSDLYDDVKASAAVQLLLDRAAAAGAELVLDSDNAPVVAAICRHLEGLPLALELAAAGARLLPPAALLARLEVHEVPPGPRDLAERQRTMTATLDWSLDLVDDTDAAVFEQLAVFSGGFTLDAAAAVTGLDDVLAPLTVLVAHSLVAPSPISLSTPPEDEPRFRLLEPVRQYAGQRLVAAGGSAAAADRHARWYRSFALDAGPRLRGPGLCTELDRLEADHANLRSAFLRLLELGHSDDAAELAATVWIYLALRGHAREGLEWLDRARVQGSDAVRARALVGRLGLLFATGDIAGMREVAWTAVPLARRVGDAPLAVEAAILAGHAAIFAGDLDRARDLLDEALVGASGAGLRWEEAHTLVAFGQLALVRGDLDEADRVLGRALEIGRSIGNDFTLATSLNRRATVTALRGDTAGTAALLAESTTRSLDSRMSWTLSYALPALAGVAVQLGEPRAAAMLFAASASLSVTDAIDPRFPVSRELAAQDLATARSLLGEAAFQEAWDAGRTATAPELADLADELTRRARA